MKIDKIENSLAYSSSVKFSEIFPKPEIISKIKLSEQIVIAGNGTSPIGIFSSAIFTTVRLAKNFSVVWKINKKKMVAEANSKHVQKVLK